MHNITYYCIMKYEYIKEEDFNMLRTLLFLFEGARLVTLITKKMRGHKVALNYKDLVILLASNWEWIAEAIKKNPAIKTHLLKLLSLLRKK